MANLTSKLKNRARREEQRENWSAAIELYSRALRAGERNGAVDISLYNRIGDIYLRLDDVDSAVGSYERAIVRYAEQDLYTSAIAVCNKVLRIQPSRISTYLQLGRLQLETGLLAEARVNYLRYATELLTRGQSDEAHAALEEYVVRTEDLNSALRFGGALVANDRGDEALSLFLRLKERLDALGRDTTSLERPIAAIRGFDAREGTPAASVRTVGALEAEMAGALEKTAADASVDPDSIVDLEAELEAAVGEEAAEQPAPPEPPALPEAEIAEGAEAPGPELPAVAFVAEPEAPEVADGDDRAPRVPAEEVEGLEPRPAPWIERRPGGVEPAEAGTPGELAAHGERDVGSTTGPAEDGSEPEERSAPTPEEGLPEAEPYEPGERWTPDGDAADDGYPAGAPEEPERLDLPTGPPPDARRPAPDATERPLAPKPGVWGPVRRSWAEAPESDALAPAARLSVELVDEDVEDVDVEAIPAPWAEADVCGEREASEPALSEAEDEEAAIPEQFPETDAPEAAAVESAPTDDEAAATPVTEGVEDEEASARLERPTARSSALPDPVESPARPETEAEAEEVGRLYLEAGRGLQEAGELERAIEELERAAESPTCFLEAHAALQECRAELSEVGGSEPSRGAFDDPDDESRQTAGPAIETSGRERAPESEPVDQPEAEPVDRPEAERPDSAAGETGILPEAAVGPARGGRASWLFSPAAAISEAAGPTEADGGEAEERQPVVEGELERIAEPEPEEAASEAAASSGQAPEAPFRQWLEAAPYDVLKRALDELERREELARALCVVERMLELRPGEPPLHRVRIAHAAELGRDEILPQAYLDLGRSLEEAGDLKGARAAYERVTELDPDRSEALEHLEALERRVEAIQPRIELPEIADADEVGATGPTDAGPEFRVPDDGAFDLAGHGRPDAAEDEVADGGGMHVYRGVVQDLGSGETIGSGMGFSLGDPLEAEREATVDFDVILAELKEQLADGVADEPDGSSRTEVGERLMDMGLLDDAIRELQAAVRSPDAPPRAFELLGRAFIEKGRPRVASRLLFEALEKLSSTVEEERLLGVLYQLGVAYQEAESPDRALECYERIFSVDIDYRDVRERIEACAA